MGNEVDGSNALDPIAADQNHAVANRGRARAIDQRAADQRNRFLRLRDDGTVDEGAGQAGSSERNRESHSPSHTETVAPPDEEVGAGTRDPVDNQGMVKFVRASLTVAIVVFVALVSGTAGTAQQAPAGAAPPAGQGGRAAAWSCTGEHAGRGSMGSRRRPRPPSRDAVCQGSRSSLGDRISS